MRLIDADLLKQNCKITGEFDNHFQCVDLITLGQVIDNQPTVDEKEIIRKAFERVVEILEEKAKERWLVLAERNGYERAIEIVKEECGINE